MSKSTIETLDEVLFDFFPSDLKMRAKAEARLRPLVGKTVGHSDAELAKKIDEALAAHITQANADKAAALKEQAEKLKAEFDARLHAAPEKSKK